MKNFDDADARIFSSCLIDRPVNELYYQHAFSHYRWIELLSYLNKKRRSRFKSGFALTS
jgi:hypothetical protein